MNRLHIIDQQVWHTIKIGPDMVYSHSLVTFSEAVAGGAVLSLATLHV